MFVIRVVIPAFNESEALGSLLSRIPHELSGHAAEVLVVDDGSTDDTAAVAAALGGDVVSSPVNRGKGAALRLGIERANQSRWDALVLMDGDGQHDPADLAALVGPILTGSADVVTADRYGAVRGRGPTPWNRYVVRIATTAILGLLTGRRFSDPYCGFKAFSPEAISVLELRGDRYQSELEILFDCVEHELTVAEIPVARVYGPGMSKMGYRRGPFLGRCAVLWQYASTIIRRSYLGSRRRPRAATSP